MSAGSLTVLPVDGMPEVVEGDDLAALIAARIHLEDHDVVLVASKIVSKAEGAVVQPREGETLARVLARAVADQAVRGVADAPWGTVVQTRVDSAVQPRYHREQRGVKERHRGAHLVQRRGHHRPETRRAPQNRDLFAEATPDLGVLGRGEPRIVEPFEGGYAAYILQRVERARAGQPFDGEDGPILRLPHGRDARVHRHAVEEHGPLGGHAVLEERAGELLGLEGEPHAGGGSRAGGAGAGVADGAVRALP